MRRPWPALGRSATEKKSKDIETRKVQSVYSGKELKNKKENAVPIGNILFYNYYSSHLWFQNSPFNDIT
jgi:hypothetical protein